MSRAATDTHTETAIPSADEMIWVCGRHVLPARVRAVVPEPYVPFFPERWNGTLVLQTVQRRKGVDDGEHL